MARSDDPVAYSQSWAPGSDGYAPQAYPGETTGYAQPYVPEPTTAPHGGHGAVDQGAPEAPFSPSGFEQPSYASQSHQPGYADPANQAGYPGQVNHPAVSDPFAKPALAPHPSYAERGYAQQSAPQPATDNFAPQEQAYDTSAYAQPHAAQPAGYAGGHDASAAQPYMYGAPASQHAAPPTAPSAGQPMSYLAHAAAEAYGQPALHEYGQPQGQDAQAYGYNPAAAPAEQATQSHHVYAYQGEAPSQYGQPHTTALEPQGYVSAGASAYEPTTGAAEPAPVSYASDAFAAQPTAPASSAMPTDTGSFLDLGADPLRASAPTDQFGAAAANGFSSADRPFTEPGFADQAGQLAADQFDAGQFGASQFGAGQIGTAEPGTAQPGAVQANDFAAASHADFAQPSSYDAGAAQHLGYDQFASGGVGAALTEPGFAGGAATDPRYAHSHDTGAGHDGVAGYHDPNNPHGQPGHGDFVDAGAPHYNDAFGTDAYGHGVGQGQDPDALMPEIVAAQAAEAHAPARGRRGLIVVGALVAAVGIGGALGLAYKYSNDTTVASDGTPPTIKANRAAMKEAPPAGQRTATRSDGLTELTGNRASGVSRTRVVSREEALGGDLRSTTNGVARQSGTRVTNLQGTSPNRVNVPGVRQVKTRVVRPDGTLVQPTAGTQRESVAIPGISLGDLQPAPRVGQPTRQATRPTRSITAPIPEAPKASTDRLPRQAARIPTPKPANTRQQVASLQRDTAAVTRPAQPTNNAAPSGLGYVVQVSSRRSRIDALAAFADLQQRYGGALSAKQPDIQ
ncbi:MAG: hypothetical protein AAFQ42_08035, partial [Pseudomonadota bacterium]